MNAPERALSTMKQSHSVAGRAVLAVIFLIGFYVLAVGLALAIGALPFVAGKYLGQMDIRILILCLICAAAILWAAVPRRDKFEAPGPKLTRDKHPRLFAEIESIARSVNQLPPADVYLVHDVNAWVAQRGGTMGLGSRRVMGLGLPLLRHLTIPEFRAVLAHEFGHYHSGDTRVGPWIYKTRSIIVRTIESLSGQNGEGNPLQWPFIWYAKLFSRITHAISRRQEFVADELAARTVGSAAMISGLRKTHSVGAAFQGYWAHEYVPVLNAGFMPPLMNGFERFLAAASVVEAVAKHMDQELQTAKVDPYDTHPPLKERIAAVEHLPPGDGGANETFAITLLEDVAELEKVLLSTIIIPAPDMRFQPMEWSELGTKVCVPPWKQLVNANARNLQGLTIGNLPATVAQRGMLFWVTAHGAPVIEREQNSFANAVVGSAIALALMEHGWQLEVDPGAPVILRNGEHSLKPFEVLDALATKKISPEDWERQCRQFGVSGIGLAPTGTPLAKAA